MTQLSDTDRNGGLGRQLVAEMVNLTKYRHGQMAIDNANRNSAFIKQGRSLAELRRETIGQGDSAIVIAAGPSIRRRDPLSAIKASGYRGALIATESAFAYCLRNGVVPDLAVTLDPHASRIVRWFGDPHLTVEKMREDDYFARQDQDAAFANELRMNEELLSLIDKQGKNIRIAVSTSASAAVVERVFSSGMQVYWWNPMLDDPDEPGSVTAQLQRDNGLPALNACGNVGSACWMMGAEVLEKKRIALTGMDFGYYADTPYENTQYYREAVDLVGIENLDSVFMRVKNPYLDSWFYTDPAYMWYRECLLEMMIDSDCKTYNCTEGGILFGDCLDFIPLPKFLDMTD